MIIRSIIIKMLPTQINKSTHRMALVAILLLTVLLMVITNNSLMVVLIMDSNQFRVVMGRHTSHLSHPITLIHNNNNNHHHHPQHRVTTMQEEEPTVATNLQATKQLILGLMVSPWLLLVNKAVMINPSSSSSKPAALAVVGMEVGRQREEEQQHRQLGTEKREKKGLFFFTIL